MVFLGFFVWRHHVFGQDLIQMMVEDFEADLDGPLSRAGPVVVKRAG